MRAGYSVLAVFIFLALALIYYAVQDQQFFTHLGGFFFIIICPVVFYLLMTLVLLICDGQLAKARPAPSLPLKMYAPDLPFCVSLFLAGAIFLLPVYPLIQKYSVRPLLFSKDFFIFIIMISLGFTTIVIALYGIFKKREVAELTEKGIRAVFMPTLSEKKDFIEWEEIKNIGADTFGPGKAPNRRVYIQLKNGGHYCLSGAIYKVHFKELKLWLQEYLSRYGSNAKPSAT